jgi:hypothetical protein
MVRISTLSVYRPAIISAFPAPAATRLRSIAAAAGLAAVSSDFRRTTSSPHAVLETGPILEK